MTTRIFYILILSIFIVSCGKDDPTPNVEFGLAPANPNQQVLTELINQFRASGQKCGTDNFDVATALVWNETLAQVAKQHSQDLDNNIGELSHTGSNQTTPRDRVENAGYSLSDNSGLAIENLAQGFTTEEDVMNAWKESAGHCKNLMDDRVVEFGVGTSGSFWTMVLASH